MADPEFAEPPKGWHSADLLNVGAASGKYWVSMGPLVRLLARQGLRLCTEQEERILLEMKRAEIVSACNRGPQCCAKFADRRRENYVCRAELVRREQLGKEGPWVTEADALRTEIAGLVGALSGARDTIELRDAQIVKLEVLQKVALVWYRERMNHHGELSVELEAEERLLEVLSEVDRREKGSG